MSDTQTQADTHNEAQNSATSDDGIKLNGLFAFKEGMATVYNDKGESVPVTVLRYETWKVSQIKTEEKRRVHCGSISSRPQKSEERFNCRKKSPQTGGF